MVRFDRGPAIVTRRPETFEIPTTFPDYDLRTTWVQGEGAWYRLENQVLWRDQDYPEGHLPGDYDKMITVFDRSPTDDGGGLHEEGGDVPERKDEERKMPGRSKSARRRKRRKLKRDNAVSSHHSQDSQEEDGQMQQNFEEQPVPPIDHDHEDRKRKALDDVPLQIKENMEKVARHQDEHDVGESRPHEDDEIASPSPPPDDELLIFLTERLVDYYEKKNKHVEYQPNKIYSQIKNMKQEIIDRAMQAAVDKEFSTWQKFDAIEVIPPAEAEHIRRNEKEKVISSRGVWTRKDADDGSPLEMKCRIVGRGFQEEFDEKLRRDSPTCSQLLVNIICSIAASRSLKLTAADVKGAFLQGLRIERELYFELPKNLGKASIKGVQPGSLLKLKKSIYGVNDAARQWYQSFKSILTQLGWEALTFENAGFVYRFQGQVIGFMALHVDDVLLALDVSRFPEECKQIEDQLRASVEWGSWEDCKNARTKFCGKSYKQLEDGTVEVDVDDYVNFMSPYHVSRDKLKQRDRSLNADEMRAFRGILGQLQWYARIAGYDVQFEVSQLASQLKGPTINDLACAAKLSRRIKQEHQGRKMIFRPGINFESGKVAVLAVHDASFANVEGHRSQKGHWIAVTNKEMLEDKTQLHAIHMLQWHSGKIQRVVRSTLSAEAYSCSEAMDSLNFLRGTLCEILEPQVVVKEYANKLHSIPGVCVTDCRSLYDCLHSERTLLSDKRLSLEAAIIRQSLQENMSIHWLSTEQQLADCLTKSLGKKGLDYVQRVLEENKWMLGPDPRLVIKRERIREEQAGKISSEEEGKALNEKFAKMVIPADMATQAILAVTVASCFTTVEGKDVGENRFTLPDGWLTMVILTVVVLLASILISYHLIHRRTLKVVTLRVLEKFEQWALVAMATWFMTILAFACGEIFGDLDLKGWQYAIYFIPNMIMMYYVKRRMNLHTEVVAGFFDTQMKQYTKTMATEVKACEKAMREEAQGIKHKLDGIRHYLKDVMDDHTEREIAALHPIEMNISAIYRSQEVMLGGHFRKLDEVSARVRSIHRGVRRLMTEQDLTNTSMGSTERRSVLRRRFDRFNQSGTATTSPDVLSEVEEDDPMANDLMMLQALRETNPDWSEAKLLEHLVQLRIRAIRNNDADTVVSLNRMIDALHWTDD